MTAVTAAPAPPPAQPPPPAPLAPHPPAARRRVRAEIRPGEIDEVFSLISSVFTMVAILCVWFLLQVLVLGGLSQERNQQLLYQNFRTQLAEATAPTGPLVDPGAPVAFLEIPQIGLSQVVIEGTASGDLLAGPGHRRDTVLPGQRGISLVYGRATTYGSPFGKLDKLRPGDQIVVRTAQGRTSFEVDGIRRVGDETLPAPTGEEARLTLVTAESHGWLSGLRAKNAIYVDATAKQGQPFPSGRPSAVPESEQAMKADLAALPMLVVALGFLFLLAVAVAAARQRWRTSLVWVVAAPVAIAGAWFTTDTVMRLLPNLM